MTPGYIYVLQNRSFGAYVLKIGLTTREPNTRSREIYSGSTGVPVPFDVAVAYSVGDCKQAEKAIHKRLAAYRLNPRREFFRMSPSVAATLTYETCVEINHALGLAPPRPFTFSQGTLAAQTIDTVANTDADPADGRPVVITSLTRLQESPVGTSTLTPDQLDRARTVGMLLARVHPKTHREWQDGFTRDVHPERELRIWEHITKAFLTIEQVEFANDDLKTEAFSLLLSRSWSPTQEVLRSANLRHFTPKSAKRLLQSYELRPKPILVGTNSPRKTQ